ncbi:MAG: nucleotidyltransferase domain-containing protein [Reyranella sp.]|nr:nucleotidyltransferase domain-containing protein [Reyranella sp.]
MTIPADIRQQIDRRLADIEGEFGVEVFYACESGSRAWDFASADSDYDVRFLYVHPRDWYLQHGRRTAPDLSHRRDGAAEEVLLCSAAVAGLPVPVGALRAGTHAVLRSRRRHVRPGRCPGGDARSAAQQATGQRGG